MKTHITKIITALLAALVLLCMFPSVALADIGPKPSVKIKLETGHPGRYYVTLLSKAVGTGPYSYEFTDDVPPDYLLKDEDAEEVKAAWSAMKQYKDSDGFYFIGFIQKCTDNSGFSWTYYPPGTFKVLIWYPDSQSFTVTDIYQRYAFDSYYKLSFVQKNAVLQQNYDYTWELISLVCRAAITIAIEILLAFAFKIKGKKMLTVVCVGNIVTQLALNIFLNAANYQNGSMAFTFYYIVAEIAIIAAEATIYTLYAKSRTSDCAVKPGRLVWYAAVSNILSFAAGLYIAHLVPGIF